LIETFCNIIPIKHMKMKITFALQKVMCWHF